jgi:hypothetical protein
MNNSSRTNRGGYESQTPDNTETQSIHEGSLWNNSIGRRVFLKKTGAATLATAVALHGVRLQVQANGTGLFWVANDPDDETPPDAPNWQEPAPPAFGIPTEMSIGHCPYDHGVWIAAGIRDDGNGQAIFEVQVICRYKYGNGGGDFTPTLSILGVTSTGAVKIHSDVSGEGKFFTVSRAVPVPAVGNVTAFIYPITVTTDRGGMWTALIKVYWREDGGTQYTWDWSTSLP